MDDIPLTLSAFPKAILHIDGDAFFASCEQSLEPKLKGKPVVTGKERNIVASMSYEAKRHGVARGMALQEVRKLCPDVVILPSDYETYSLLSKRFFDIVRRYTSAVEEYSIDECFADITGLRRPLRMSYPEIARRIQEELERDLGTSFSVGLGPTKVLAKVASKWNKPSGLTVIPGMHAHRYLARLPLEKVWGIGPQTTAYLEKERLRTALDFALRPEEWVKEKLTKPHYEIWRELRGESVLTVVTEEKRDYQSISKMKTFRPFSSDKAFIFAQLSRNIENACIKARRYQLAAREVICFLRTQNFEHHGVELKLSRGTALPNEIVRALEEPYEGIYRPGEVYRATGVVLTKLEKDVTRQMDLFDTALCVERMQRLFAGVDALDRKFGKHTVTLGSSLSADRYNERLRDRGDAPKRKTDLFKGENARQRLALPFMGEVG
jgi:DNA polymerase IV